MTATTVMNTSVVAEHRFNELVDALEHDYSAPASNPSPTAVSALSVQLQTSARRAQVAPLPALAHIPHRDQVDYESDDSEFEDLFTFAPKRIRPYKSEMHLLSPRLLSHFPDVPKSMPTGQVANLDDDTASIDTDCTLVRPSAVDSRIASRHRRCATVDSASMAINKIDATMATGMDSTATKADDQKSLKAFPTDVPYYDAPLKRSASRKRLASIFHAEPMVNAIARFRKESNQVIVDGSHPKMIPTPAPTNERCLGRTFGSLGDVRLFAALRKSAGATQL